MWYVYHSMTSHHRALFTLVTVFSPRLTSSADPLCDLSHIVSSSESELRAKTDYTQCVTVYGITDISLSGCDVIQIGSQLRDPDTVQFVLSLFRVYWRYIFNWSLWPIIFHAHTSLYLTIFRPQHPQISRISFFTSVFSLWCIKTMRQLWDLH